MSSLLYRNIAGRCGRPGQFTEGDVLIYDNPAGDADWTHPARRRESQQTIFFSDQSPKLRTAIRHSELGKAIVGSQLLAAVKENPTMEDLGLSFFSATFASHLEPEARENAQTAITEAIDSILHDDPPLAAAASPLTLTDVGAAANQTGLSPITVRRLLATLSGLADDGDLPAVGSMLLRGLADVPEQQNMNLSKTVNNSASRFMIKPDDFAPVIESWIGGVPLDQMFHSLPANQRSKRKPQLDLWLQGVSDESQWEDVFEQFTDFVHSVLENYLPWLLRSASILAPHANLGGELPWTDWASQVEKGVSHPWAIWALDHGAPTDREALMHVARSLHAAEITPELASPGDASTVLPILESAMEPLQTGSPLAGAVGKILDWYYSNYG
jgi:helicase